MLLTLLYHKIGTGKYSNSREMLEAHFRYLATNYKIVLPGDVIDPLKLNICLTFDDAYYDFYDFVYPILKKLKIKAQLAVPVKYIQHHTSVSRDIRLSVPYTEAEKEYLQKTPFCTWKEIKEMHSSEFVAIASHSYSHCNLLAPGTDLNLEIVHSKELLENILNISIDTFVYPFGKFNNYIHNFTKNHYQYIMRIGSALNLSWGNGNKLIYRLSGDNLKSVNDPVKINKIISCLFSGMLNILRRR